MASFCDRASMDDRSIRFLFDGTILTQDATAEGLGNYYHLSPHVRANVLCAPPRTRYVFLKMPIQVKSARHEYM